MTNIEDELGDERTALRSNHETSGAELDATSVKKDPMAVKFVNGGEKNDDVLIDVKLKDEEFVGLKKEELEKFASDPYWVRIRIILLVLFGLIWAGMLVAAIAIIVVAPKCPPRPDQEWWETAIVYQLNPNSFLDTNGDGSGDIKGIKEKVKYLKESLRVSAVNLGPFYPSPRRNFGYDLIDFKSVCGHYGTMDDFDALRVSMHKEGMKLILDFIPNHTSRKHKWFKASQNKTDIFKDFYMWKPGSTDSNGTRRPPNGWLNEYGQSAWTFDEVRGEFYYHSYSKDEPDLNLGNHEVVRLLDDALQFWLEKQVDGFRFIGAEHLFEPNNLEDSNMVVQNETFQLISHWRELMDNYSFSYKLPKSRRFSRVLIVDVGRNANESAKFLEYDGRPGAHLPTNKILESLKESCNADCVYSLLQDWSNAIESNSKIANWQVGDHNTSRVVTRMSGKEYLNAINLLLLTLPGTSFVYNGDELGMKDVVFDPKQNYSLAEDLIPRAGQHSPMQWSDKPNAGFTSSKPWVPVSDDYAETNVEAETAHGSGMSHINVFGSLAKLKEEPSIQWGKLHLAVTKSVVCYVRQAEGFAGYLVAINFGPSAATVNFRESVLKDYLPDESKTVKVVESTYNFDGLGRDELYKADTAIQLNTAVHLKPSEGIVLKWEPQTSLL